MYAVKGKLVSLYIDTSLIYAWTSKFLQLQYTNDQTFVLKTFLIHQKVLGRQLIVNIYCGNTKNWVKEIGVCVLRVLLTASESGIHHLLDVTWGLDQNNYLQLKSI